MAARGQEGRGADDRPGEAARRLARAAGARQRGAPGRPGPVRRRRDRDRGRRAVGDDARREGDLRRGGPRRTRPTPRRATGSSRTASTSSSPPRSPARRSTWRWRSCSRSTPRTATTCWSSTRRRRRNALDFLEAPRAADAVHRGPGAPGLHAPDRARDEGLRARDLDDVLASCGGSPGSSCSRTCRSSSRRSAAWSGGFRERARRVNELLARPRDLVPVVCGPQGEPITEAVYFHRKLVEAEMPFGGVIVNKVHYEGELPGARRGELARASSTQALGDAELADRVAANFEDFRGARRARPAQHRAADGRDAGPGGDRGPVPGHRRPRPRRA